MKENFVQLSHNLIFALIAASAFIFPLFFLPVTSEFFDFNKFTALFVITLTGLIIWGARMVIEKKASFTRTPLDLPLIIFLVVVFIASLSSIDQYTSIYGSPQSFWPSFFPLATLIAFYFLVVSNLKKRKQVNIILWLLCAATTTGALISIASYFGLFFPFDFAQIRSFNPLGVINRFAVFESFIIPLTAYWAIFEKEKSLRMVALLLTLVLSCSLVLINFLPAFIGLIFAGIFLAVSSSKTKLDKGQQGNLALLFVFIILFLVIRFVPQVSEGTLNSWILKKDPSLSAQEQIKTPKETSLPLQASWDVAAQAIGKRPLLGTGPSTFKYVYTQLKPPFVNTTDQWATRFLKSTSDMTEYLATIGIFGMLAYLLIIVASLRFVWTLTFKSQHNAFYLGLCAAIISFIISTVLTNSSFATVGGFFLIIALLSALAKAQDESNVYDVTLELSTLKSHFSWFPLGSETQEGAGKGARSQLMPLFFIITVLMIGIFAAKTQAEAFMGEYYYRQALLASRSNDGNKTINFIQKAISANPAVDTYHRSLAQFTLNAAINLTTKGNLSDQEKQLLSQLVQVATDQAKIASGYQILPLRVPGIAAANVENWEVLSGIYQALIGSVSGADVHATNTLTQALALDPKNPILHDRLGQLYQRLGNLDLAQRKYEDSIYVKNDYGPGHFRLAKILIERKGDVPKIVNSLTLAKRFLDPKDPAISQIDSDLDKYNKQLAELIEKSKVAGEKTEAEKKDEGASPTPSPSTSPSPQISSPSPEPSPEVSPSL